MAAYTLPFEKPLLDLQNRIDELRRVARENGVADPQDAAGLEVKQIQLADVKAGSQNFIWDGSAKDGTRAADGAYTVELTALAEGEKVSGRTLEFGPVTSVIRGAAGTDFQVGSLGIFKYDDIKQIL